MPELPEVEAARRAVAEHSVGKKIIRAIVAADAKVIDGVSPTDFEAALVGKTIVAAHRKGKNMWIELDSPPFPSFQFANALVEFLVHKFKNPKGFKTYFESKISLLLFLIGMAGAVYIKGVAVTKYKRSAVKDTDEWPSKYSKLFVELDDGVEFSFTDKRRFAKVRLLDNPVSLPPISELGPDALTEPMTEDEFHNSLKKKKNLGIKAHLLDQSFISGIGNWMADEVLYQARIHPMQSAASLSKENCSTLLKCINEVTALAVEVDADSLRFPTEWLFHFRWGKKPGKVNGKKLDFIKAGGRTTAYVPELQKLTGNQTVKDTGKKPKRNTGGKSVSINESGSEDETAEPEVVKGKKTTSALKSSNKKSKTAVEDSDDAEDEDEDDDDVPSKRKRGAMKPPAKGKPKGDKNGGVQKRQARGKGGSTKRKHEESDDELSNSS